MRKQSQAILLKEDADLFRCIGKMKRVKVDLHVDPAITPVAQAHSRIPFSVRPKLEAELEKIEADDIIERVEKPTSWVSPVVITPKRSSNEIRLNVCLLYTSPSPRDGLLSRMPSSA